MNLRILILPILILAGCQADVAEPPLAGARIGGPFALTDQNGRPRTDRDFAGRYRIMYFGYTFCPDVCPVDVAKLTAGLGEFARSDPSRAARVTMVFVSVDPERDMPAVLKQFIAPFGPDLVGLTGTSAQVAAIAKAYGVVYAAQKSPGNAAYLVDHSRTAYLMDPDGKPLALLSQDARPEVIAGELAKWVR
jgi:protein SCO1